MTELYLAIFIVCGTDLFYLHHEYDSARCGIHTSLHENGLFYFGGGDRRVVLIESWESLVTAFPVQQSTNFATCSTVILSTSRAFVVAWNLDLLFAAERSEPQNFINFIILHNYHKHVVGLLYHCVFYINDLCMQDVYRDFQDVIY